VAGARNGAGLASLQHLEEHLLAEKLVERQPVAASALGSELRPQRIEAGKPAQVVVENLGDMPRAFSLAWQSPDGLDFEPPAQELLIPPGEAAPAEFRARPRSRPLFGGARLLVFTTRVQTAGGSRRYLHGEVVARPWIPSWVLPAALATVVAMALIWVLAFGLAGP
jgi:hypothetical protein